MTQELGSEDGHEKIVQVRVLLDADADVKKPVTLQPQKNKGKGK